MQPVIPPVTNSHTFTQDYLQRIHTSGPLTISLETLRQLHKQHQLFIPIENLDIHAGRKIVLDIEAFKEKIIYQKRGGFCYELNGLFYELLKNIGFQVKMISGRVYLPGTDGGHFRDEFDHMAILVQLGGTQWLADVAMGRLFALYPLQLIVDIDQEDPTGTYRISKYDNEYLALQQKTNQSEWAYAYIFTLTPRCLQDFAAMCEVQQTSPKSYFTQNKLATIVTPQGRITLTDTKLKITNGSQVQERAIISKQDFEHTLHEYFGIGMEF